MDKFKIVADSSSDLTELSGLPLSAAPLKILTERAEYVDDPKLDVGGMVDALAQYKGKSSTSCPNPEDWLKAFGDAEYILGITISGNISGSYNAAVAAKELYEGLYPDRRVFILDSRSTGPEMKLIVEKIQELIAEGNEFDFICKKATEYCRHTGLLFMLESMKNLANNGRVNPLVAKAVGLLGIRIIGRASEEGTLQPLDKCKGQEKALQAIVRRMKELGCRGGKVFIAHCFNEDAAQRLKELLRSEIEKVRVEIYMCRGLCSFYAERGGLLVGFETC